VPERIVLLASLAILITLTTLAVRMYSARRLTRLKTVPLDPLWATLGEQPDGRRTLVTFSTPSCAACHKAQAPAVGKVKQQLGPDGVRIIEINAAERPEIARAFGVLTVPSTAVLAAAGHVVAVNQGFAPSTKLVQQLQNT
jgi:thiol-disulfide isomerase/thioredoxin